MLVWRSAIVLALGVSLTACGGGGGSGSSSGAVPSGGSSAPQAGDVKPTFTFVLPARSSANASSVARAAATPASSRRSPAYISPGAEGVTITLLVEGQPSVSVTTDLTTPGVCTGTPLTCTVSGPAIPPGTDQLQVALYDTEPTGSPLAEPANANVLAQSSSTANPVTPNPTYTIAPGAGQQLSVTLFGVPKVLVAQSISLATIRNPKPQANRSAPNIMPAPVVVPLNGTFTADTQDQQGPISVTVEDAAHDAISGQFSEPVTVTDDDPAIGSPAGAYATGVACCGSTTGAASVSLNSSSDVSSLIMTYGGLDEIEPNITISATGATSVLATPFRVTTYPISVSAEVDLYATSGPGSSGTFTLSEPGWSDPPYAQNFSYQANGCTSGTAATTYSLGAFGAPDGSGTVSVLDTAPSNAVSGDCTILLGSFDATLQNANETLTYTSGSFVINARNRTR